MKDGERVGEAGKWGHRAVEAGGYILVRFTVSARRGPTCRH